MWVFAMAAADLLQSSATSTPRCHAFCEMQMSRYFEPPTPLFQTHTHLRDMMVG